MFIVVCVIVVSPELTSTVTQFNLSLMSFASDHLYLFSSEFVFRLRCIFLSPHTNNYIILPSILI